MTKDTTTSPTSSQTGSETRNIIDHYHYWKHEAILADLDSRANNFSIICSNLYNDFNIATCIRNANAFLAKRVFVYAAEHSDWAMLEFRASETNLIPESELNLALS